MSAPVESLTVPTIVPNVDWANDATAPKVNMRTTQTLRLICLENKTPPLSNTAAGARPVPPHQIRTSRVKYHLQNGLFTELGFDGPFVLRHLCNCSLRIRPTCNFSAGAICEGLNQSESSDIPLL